MGVQIVAEKGGKFSVSKSGIYVRLREGQKSGDKE